MASYATKVKRYHDIVGDGGQRVEEAAGTTMYPRYGMSMLLRAASMDGVSAANGGAVSLPL